MATEHPRQHVWSGDDHVPLITFVVTIGDMAHTASSHSVLVKAQNIGIAVSLAIFHVPPIPDHWDDLAIVSAPLNAEQLKKVNLKDNEVFDLDLESLGHLISGENDE